MKVGDLLHASCSDEDYEILAIGKDANGNDCLSIRVPDLNKFLTDPGEGDWRGPNLMYVEPNEVILRDVPWRRAVWNEDIIELNTPGNGCGGCTKYFSVEES